MSLFPPDGAVLEDVVDRLFRFFAIAECRVHDANPLQVCSQATVSCLQPEDSGLLMSCESVDWVSIGVVVSSGSFGPEDDLLEKQRRHKPIERQFT